MGLLAVKNGAFRPPPPAYLVPALKLETVEERESFTFFTSYAVPSLQGFLDSPFWQREVLQAVHREPAIQHCVVALGAMHRRFHQGRGSHLIEKDMSEKYLQFALRQSNRAIQGLLKGHVSKGKLGRPDRMTLMTCTILFASMSCLQGHNRDALEHLKSGIRMLNEADEEDDASSQFNHPVEIESLRSVFIGLDMQARSIMPASSMRKNWVARPKTNPINKLPGTCLNMPSLLTLLRYTESLLGCIHNLFQDSFSRPKADAHDVYVEYKKLIKQYQRGANSLANLYRQAAASKPEFEQPLSALRLLKCMTEFFLRSGKCDVLKRFDLPDDTLVENEFDGPFDPAAQCFDMFELATRLLPTSSSDAPVFTTTIGPVAALWIVAMRGPSSCSALRKRAVMLMLKYPRREGFWDGMVAGQVAQEALNLEAESTRAELGVLYTPECDLVTPDDLRIVMVRINYDGADDRRASVEFCNRREVATEMPGRVRSIRW